VQAYAQCFAALRGQKVTMFRERLPSEARRSPRRGDSEKSALGAGRLCRQPQHNFFIVCFLPPKYYVIQQINSPQPIFQEKYFPDSAIWLGLDLLCHETF
jgi:hypothetical protein